MDSLVKRVLKESLKEMGASHIHSSSTEPPRSPAREAQGQDTLESLQPSLPSAAFSDIESEIEDLCVGFDFDLVSPLVRAVREALIWEEPVVSPQAEEILQEAEQGAPEFPVSGRTGRSHHE